MKHLKQNLKKTSLLAGALVLALGLAACGDSTETATTGDELNVPAAEFVAAEEGSTSLKATGFVTYTFTTEHADEWADEATAVYMKPASDSEFTEEHLISDGKYTLSSSKMTIDSDLLSVDVASTVGYDIVIQSGEYEDFNLALDVTNYVPDTFVVRTIDGDGNVVESTEFSYDEMATMSVNQDYYTIGCVMHGMVSLDATGIYLTDLFDAAGVEFSEGMSLAIRATDSATEIVATEINNSTLTGETFENPEQYWIKPRFTDNFKRTYDELYGQESYFYYGMWEDEEIMAAAVEDAGAFDIEFREVLVNEDYMTAVEPMIAIEYTSLEFRSYADDIRTYDDELSELTSTERAFRFVTGTGFDPDPTTNWTPYDDDLAEYPLVSQPEYEGVVAVDEGVDPCGNSARSGMLIFGIDIFLEG